MITYTATSLKFTGWVEYTYNNAGQLVCIDIRNAQLSEAQFMYLWENRPVSLELVDAFKTKSALSFTEKLQSVTFEQFYETYGYKEGKKKAETAWNKLSAIEQVKAYNYIPTLRTKKITNSTALPYPVTYVNQQRWND